jgi:hypothetical protein
MPTWLKKWFDSLAFFLLGLLLLLVGVAQLRSSFSDSALCDCAADADANDNNALRFLRGVSLANDLPYEFDRVVNSSAPGRIVELQAKLLLLSHARVRELEAERKLLLNRLKKLGDGQ